MIIILSRVVNAPDDCHLDCEFEASSNLATKLEVAKRDNVVAGGAPARDGSYPENLVELERKMRKRIAIVLKHRCAACREADTTAGRPQNEAMTKRQDKVRRGRSEVVLEVPCSESKKQKLGILLYAREVPIFFLF